MSRLPKSLAKQIRGHPIAAFFAIAIGISFLLLFPALRLPQSNLASQLISFYLARLGIYSPVIAGMVVSYFLNTTRGVRPFRQRFLIFLPTWILALAAHTADMSVTAPEGVGLAAMAVLSMPVALLPAFVLTSSISRVGGIRNMLHTLTRPRGHIVYYLFALLAFPLTHYAGMVLDNAMNGESLFPALAVNGRLATTLIATFAGVFFFSGGINEESGWRGFAQKHLQGKFSPLSANLLLWVGLVVWHIPNDLLQYQDGGYVLIRLGLYPFITILFGWVYNRTGGCILAPAIFHASMNTMNPLGDVLPMTTAGNYLLLALAVLVLLTDRMWRKLPEDHPAVYREAP